MAGTIKIDIAESADELQKKLRQAIHPTERGKLQMLWWLKLGKVSTLKEIANWSGYHRTCISRWLSKYRQGGLKTLLERKKSSGRPSVRPPQVRKKLQEALSQETGFRSYKEIQQWLKLECDLELEYKTVHKIVRYDMGAKLKRPRPCSVKQAAGAVETFKKTSLKN